MMRFVPEAGPHPDRFCVKTPGRPSPIAPHTTNLSRMAQTHQLSQPAFDRLKSEHDQLTTIGRVDIARKIETARELGDLSENGDYHAAKEEQGKMEGRIAHLAQMIDNAVIIEDDGGTEIVSAGSIVSIRYEGDDDVERYLLGSIEERHEGLDVISPSSPMGSALMGAKQGDTVNYQAPGGTLAVEVVSIG
jgi:transcription elongation factor GreA